LFDICARMVDEIHANSHCGDSMAHGEDDEFHVDNLAWAMHASVAETYGARNASKPGKT